MSGQLYNGRNVIAVEVHQAAVTSSDLGFDLGLTGVGDTGGLPDPPHPPAPTPTTITITVDAHVRDGSRANNNYATATAAEVQNGSAGNTRWYFLQVDTTAYAGPVSTAVLRVRCQGAKGKTTPVVVKAVDTSWTETGLTWNTKPVPGATVATGTVVGTTATWPSSTVTSYVAAERAAGRNVLGFVVQATLRAVRW